jgi:hypothetical protein
MDTRKIKLSAEHPSILMRMANLAFTMQSAGQYSQVIDLLKTCVAKPHQILGPSIPVHSLIPSPCSHGKLGIRPSICDQSISFHAALATVGASGVAVYSTLRFTCYLAESSIIY